MGMADPENAKKIFAEADKMFEAINKGFKAIFHPSLWK